MRLLDLEPQWINDGCGVRIGFMFRCPTNPEFWQTCFRESPQRRVQREIFERMFGEDNDHVVQGCTPGTRWSWSTEDFATISVTPSIDGSPGGLWHGFVTDGDIR